MHNRLQGRRDVEKQFDKKIRVQQTIMQNVNFIKYFDTKLFSEIGILINVRSTRE